MVRDIMTVKEQEQGRVAVRRHRLLGQYVCIHLCHFCSTWACSWVHEGALLCQRLGPGCTCNYIGSSIDLPPILRITAGCVFIAHC
jgi:hypothetical protein